MAPLVIDPEPVEGSHVLDGTRRQRTLGAPRKREETCKHAHYRVAPLLGIAFDAFMEFIPPQKIGDLRKGRVSIPGARYFITVCTLKRKRGLTNQGCATAILDALRRQQRDEDIALDCATIMPDHAHLLLHLGKRLTLSQTQAKFKALTRSALHAQGLSWQDNYFDHRLRHEKSMEPFARYIFLNPYRKGLIRRTETWPWWVLNRNYRPEFILGLGDDPRPPKEWLGLATDIEELIEADIDS